MGRTVGLLTGADMTELMGIGRLDPDDPATARRVRARRGRAMLLAVGIGTAAFAVVAVVLAFVGWDKRFVDADRHPSGALQVAAFALMLIGAGAELAVLIFAVRTGRARRNRRSPLWLLTVSQRRRLKRQIMTNTVDAGADLAALRLIATEFVDRRWLIFIVAGGLLGTAGGALINPAPVQLAMMGLLAVASGWITVEVLHQARRAKVFLHTHPSST